jgi:hypothetical protein
MEGEDPDGMYCDVGLISLAAGIGLRSVAYCE